MNDKAKKKILNLLILLGITIFIYLFLTDGGTTTFSKQLGLGKSGGSSASSIVNFFRIQVNPVILVAVVLLPIIARSLYEHYVKKPKQQASQVKPSVKKIKPLKKHYR